MDAQEKQYLALEQQVKAQLGLAPEVGAAGG
jgi:hypothetical protein